MWTGVEVSGNAPLEITNRLISLAGRNGCPDTGVDGIGDKPNVAVRESDIHPARVMTRRGD